jgi:hypothetical protein
MLLQRFATPRVSRFPRLRLAVPRFAVRPAWRRERDGNAADGGVAWRPAAHGYPHAVMSRASDRALCVVVRGAGADIVAFLVEFTVYRLVAAIPFRSVGTHAARVVGAFASSVPGSAAVSGAASTAEQYRGGPSPTVAGRPVLLSCRGGAMTPIPGPAATPTRGRRR